MEKTFEQRVAEAMAAVPAVTPEQASEQRAANPATLFVDPRGVDDIRATTGMIPDALNLSLDDLSDRPEEQLPADLRSRSRPIIAACEGGPMGALAAYALQRRGYTNVAFISGGTRGWLEAGYATAR